MALKQQPYGLLPDGRKTDLYILTNVNDVEVSVTNYGGIITSIKTPDKTGVFKNIVLGLRSFKEYLKNDPYLGALVGRVSNRISNARFDLDGKTYKLAKNEGENHLHGGLVGFEKILWEVEVVDDQSIRLSYVSPDGEEGYPGNLHVSVTYTLDNDNKLTLKFGAMTDKTTPISFTSHGYFNLTGDPSKNIYDHQLKLYADSFTPTDQELIPTGAVDSVQDTPLDFRDFKPIGEDIGQTKIGFDNNFVLNKPEGELALAAEVEEPQSGRRMNVYTSMPCMQLYTGNYLDNSLQSPERIPFRKHCAFCLEPQHYPDAPNRPEFPSGILRPGKNYKAKIVYEFF
ncbi:MAG: galactose mutarotase [Balneolaceae bacterium]|nr:galactose mutarotase [Balneolaceae bacterium]